MKTIDIRIPDEVAKILRDNIANQNNLLAGIEKMRTAIETLAGVSQRIAADHALAAGHDLTQMITWEMAETPNGRPLLRLTPPQEPERPGVKSANGTDPVADTVPWASETQ